MKKILLFTALIAMTIMANADKTEIWSMQLQSKYSVFISMNETPCLGGLTTTPMLYAYDDGSYCIKSWCGVEGYDLEFTIDDQGLINVTNGTEKTGKTGYEGWRVLTGLADYPQVKVYQSATYSPCVVNKECVSLDFMTVIGYKTVGQTTNGDYLYYWLGGYNSEWTKTGEVTCTYWSDEEQKNVDMDFMDLKSYPNRTIHYIADGDYYVIEQWAGEGSGDLVFSVDDDDALVFKTIYGGYSGIWGAFYQYYTFQPSAQDYTYFYGSYDADYDYYYGRINKDEQYTFFTVSYEAETKKAIYTLDWSTLAPEPSTYSAEDVNHDNSVDSQDVLKIYDFMKTSTGSDANPVEDVNGDSNVDSQDVLKVYDYMKSH